MNVMNSTESIGKRIKRLRKVHGMTQDELANAVGVSPQAVSKWENDYSCPDISILPTLAKVLGISTDELLSGENTGGVEGEFIENPDSGSNDGISFEYNSNNKHHSRWRGPGGISSGKIWWGIFIILVGAVLILKNATNFIPWGFWSIIWPSAIICFGMGELCRRPGVFNVSVTALGVYLLLCNIDVIPPSFSGKWIIIGAFLIIGGISAVIPKRFKLMSFIKHGRHPGAARELHCENGYIQYECDFCQDTAAFSGGTLHGGNIETSFGSAVVDLTPLTMVGEDAALNIDVSFGSLTLLLPRTVRLIETRDAAFASVNVKGAPNGDAPYNLNIVYDVSFGSIDVQYM